MLLPKLRVHGECIPSHHHTLTPSQETVVSAWVDQGIMDRVQRNKLVFVETRDSGEISLALKNYFKVSE